MKPRVAIACNFPSWLISPDVPVFQGHYAVWLKALYDAYPTDAPFELHWVSLNKDVTHPVRFESRGQYFHVLPRTKKTIGLYSAYIADRIRIACELKKIRPALLHSWGTEDCYGLSGTDFKGKWLHSVQGLLKTCIARGPMPRFFRHHSFYEPSVLKNCKHLTTESPWAAARVQEIAPGASPVQFEYAVEDRFFRQIRELAQNPTCLYCGSYTPLKNVECAVRAFARPELAHIKLELAGVEPGCIPNLPQNVIPLGRISRDEVVQKLAQAWCLVHPSKADTGPTAAKEARVMGLPVVVSDQCGSQQYVDHGKSGYVISPDNVEALASAVIDITSSRARCEQMGSFNQDKCRQSLSAGTMLNRFIELYQHILSE